MNNKSFAAIAGVAIATGFASSAGAAVTLYYDDFSSLSPPAGGFTTTTNFGTGDHSYHVAGAPSGTPGNVDIVSSTYMENGAALCPTGTCIDLDGTGTGRKEDYFWTDKVFTLNPSDTYRVTVTANATTRNQSSPFLFGFLSPTDADYPLNYPSVYYKTVAGGDIQSGLATYIFEIVPNATSARLFFENITNGSASDNIGALISTIRLENVSAVPLPAAAWLLLSGLAGVGLIGRRRRGLVRVRSTEIATAARD